MRRIFQICIFAIVLSATATAQTTLSGSISITISFAPLTPTCSISSTAPTINFAATTSARTQFQHTSPAFPITFSGTNIDGIRASLQQSGSMDGGTGTTIPYSTSLTCPSNAPGCPGVSGGGFSLNYTCNCSIAATARIPAQAPAGSYSGTSTLTVTCVAPH